MNSLIKSITDFIHPHREFIIQIRNETREQIIVAEESNKRIKDMIATLNGEETWFLRVTHPNKEGSNDVHSG